jgi:hypothetical protein
MAELGAFFGNPNLQRQGAKARALAAQRDVNTLADPRTYAVVQGLLGTAPDEMGFSVLNPNYEKIRKVAEPAFALGLLGQASPLLAPMTKGLPVGASIKNIGKFDVFHGSKNKNITELDPSKSFGDLGVSWVTPDEKFAQRYSGKSGKVYKMDLLEGKNFDFSSKDDIAKLKNAAKEIEYYDPVRGFMTLDKRIPDAGDWKNAEDPRLFNLIKDMGYDSVSVYEDGVKNIGVFNPKKSIKFKESKPSYPQQEALDTAQRNAALPIEEGGLGLPKDNTPEMRAKAMGYDVPAYHGTTVWEADDGRKLGDIKEFNRLASTEIVGRKPSLDQVGIWASDRPDELGAGMYSGSQGAIYPLMLRMQNPKTTSFEQMARTASNLSSGEPLGAGVVPRVSNVEPYRQMLKEQDFDSLMIKAKEGSPYTEFADQTGYVLLDPSQIRSRFAAFDPMRRNEADILAGVLPLGLLADEEQRKKLYELMPSLLGE